MDYMDMYRQMHIALDEDQKNYELEQILLDKQNAEDVEKLRQLTRKQIVSEGMAVFGGGQNGMHLARGDGLRGTPSGDIFHVSSVPLFISDIHIGAPRANSAMTQAIAALAAGMSTMSFAMTDAFDEWNRAMRLDSGWSRNVGHLFNHAPTFLDSGVYWREKKRVRAIVNTRNQSRKDLAKNANRYNHTQKRNLKRDIVNAIKRK